MLENNNPRHRFDCAQWGKDLPEGELWQRGGFWALQIYRIC